MSKQLPLKFEDPWWMEVVISLSKDKREEAIFVLKEMMVAYLQMKRTRGAQNGECRD